MRKPKPKAKPGKPEYRRRLPHFQHEGDVLFVTSCTFKGFVLPESVRTLVLDHCLHDHGLKLWMFVTVVMPDHIHLLCRPLADDEGTPYSLAEIVHSIKGASAHAVNRQLNRKGSLWQREYFDHVLRSDESIREKTDYICMNPVRKGLAESPDDYPWLWREWIERRA